MSEKLYQMALRRPNRINKRQHKVWSNVKPKYINTEGNADAQRIREITDPNFQVNAFSYVVLLRLVQHDGPKFFQFTTKYNLTQTNFICVQHCAAKSFHILH